MAVQIIVDSSADFLPDEVKALGLHHLPMKVRFGEEEFEDTITLTHRQFYEKLVESDVFPTTAQVTPAEYEAAFAAVAEQGDTAVCITVSSKLSGTYQSACIAAEEFADTVCVVDSANVAVGERVLVMLALRLRDEGMSAKDIAARLDEEKTHIRLLALVDTLEYLKKGGRLSTASAVAGTLLSIKPVLGIENGEVKTLGKARGSKQANNLLRELIAAHGMDFDKPFYLGYSGLSDALLQKYIEDSAELWQGYTQSLPVTTIGCVIGAHAGPGAIAVAFFEKR